jgi:hypothetical protein
MEEKRIRGRQAVPSKCSSESPQRGFILKWRGDRLDLKQGKTNDVAQGVAWEGGGGLRRTNDRNSAVPPRRSTSCPSSFCTASIERGKVDPRRCRYNSLASRRRRRMESSGLSLFSLDACPLGRRVNPAPRAWRGPPISEGPHLASAAPVRDVV